MADWRCNDIALEIEAMLDGLEAPMTNECCIYKVPHEIRKLNNDAFIPKVVSIGPLHHGNHNLQNMETEKRIYLRRFLARTNANLHSLVSLVKELEPKVRCCYSENIKYSKEDFVKMILLDAGFILELFCNLTQFYFPYEDWTKGDALSVKEWLLDDIVKDLYLLENQLPFLVLDGLYNLAYSTPPIGEHPPKFIERTFWVFRYYNKNKIGPGSVTIHHFTDLLRTFYLHPHKTQSLAYGEVIISSVTQLHEAGVKFKANKKKRLLDLEFSGNALKIPQLTVDDETGMFFANMIALEQCHYRDEQDITNYVFLLSCLVKTDEDADLLVKNRIIVNYLDQSNTVARLFYSLRKNTPLTGFSDGYSRLCEQVDEFCKNPKRKMIAALRRDFFLDLKRTYCRTPLQTLATIGGILLLILTFIQTVCSILQVV